MHPARQAYVEETAVSKPQDQSSICAYATLKSHVHMVMESRYISRLHVLHRSLADFNRKQDTDMGINYADLRKSRLQNSPMDNVLTEAQL
jgi:hypothetical protein